MPTRITPEQVAARLQAEPTTIYLDVRSTPEFAAGHPAGAYNLPIMEPDPATGMMLPNPQFVEQAAELFAKDQAIITGCKSGGRSLQAATLMERAGFTNVVDMLGGFHGQSDPQGQKVQAGWLDSDLPVETETQPGHDFASLLARVQAA